MLRPRIWKIHVFMWLFIITPFISIVGVNTPVHASKRAVLAAPIIVDQTLTSGTTFYINITVADVSGMWGYEFFFYYDTTVLTATSCASYSPFDLVWSSGTNDTAGYAFMAYTMTFGEKVGFATAEPKPIARIDFTVDGLGTSTLDLFDSMLPSVSATYITHDAVDGFFANVVLPANDIGVTYVSASPTTVTAGLIVTIDVIVWNKGTQTETFDVVVKYDDAQIGTQTVTNLASLTSASLSFSWNTTGVTPGDYVIKAVASVVEGEIDTADNTRVDGTVTVKRLLKPPVASFTLKPQTPYVGENVTFDASASYDPDGTIVKYIWYFGDYTSRVEETNPITTHVYKASGTYSMFLNVVDDDGLYSGAGAYVTVLPGLLIKLLGELDYFWKERVKIRLSALVKDVKTMETVSNANVTIKIYDPDGNLWVSDVMAERLEGTAIYEWESSDTIEKLQLEKGVYLVHAMASYRGSPTASDILEFHIDPPAEIPSDIPIYYVIVPIIACAAGSMMVFLKRSPFKARRFFR